MNSIILKTLDEKNLHNSKINPKAFPEPDIPADEAWAEMKNLLTSEPGKLRHIKSARPALIRAFFYTGVAIAAVALTTYFLSSRPSQIKTQPVTYHTEDTPRKNILPDGTIAFLDRHSSIKEIVKENEEPVFSIQGAAYFECDRRDNRQASHIQAGSFDVSLSNGKAYILFDAASGISSVHVDSGTVIIETNGQKTTLESGQSIWFDENAKRLGSKERTDINLFSYATGIFQFSDAPLQEVAASIGKAYGVQIILKSKNLYNCRITTRFDNKSLKEILDVMSYTLNFEYSIDETNKRVLLTGNGCE
ncbi:MAG: DUF4974 domain-containing protein [Bacteroidetes bacterium]|nr:DUF4974 domain-containing protein [Bacteroidota bacterium]